MTPDQAISGWLRILAREFVANRAKDIRQRKLLNTELLISSLSAKVNSQPERGIHFMVFYSLAYGRYQDMRRRYTRAGGEEMIKLLEQWADREGVGNFTRRGVRDYSGIYRNQPKARILNRIAWGIANRYRDKGTAPKKGWYNKGKTKDIETQYDVLLRIWKEAVQAQTVEKLSK